MADCDVMISYHPDDYDFVATLQARLRSAGFSLWCMEPDRYYDEGSSALRADAIVRSKVYVTVLSSAAAQDALIKDELSLAYVSNKPLYPLGRQYYRAVAAHMDAAMKLILAKINWTFFVKEGLFEDSYENLITCLRNELVMAGQNTTSPELEEDPDEDGRFHQMNERTNLIQHPPLRDDEGGSSLLPVDSRDETERAGEHTNGNVQEDFWRRHFKDQELVSWDEFKDKFHEDYSYRLEEIYGSGDPGELFKVMHRDIFSNKPTISIITYNRFIGTNKTHDPDHFCERIKDYAKGRQALKEVLGMDSSVRLTAVQNIAKFQTPAVISILLELVADEDPNMRAIAALALAKSGRRTRRIEDVLMSLLEDEDRVVRESACLSLAHIRCERATMGIIDLWRNDAIKHVREAAEIALHRIGGDQADQAIKMTDILQGEMKNLREAAAAN